MLRRRRRKEGDRLFRIDNSNEDITGFELNRENDRTEWMLFICTHSWQTAGVGNLCNVYEMMDDSLSREPGLMRLLSPDSLRSRPRALECVGVCFDSVDVDTSVIHYFQDITYPGSFDKLRFFMSPSGSSLESLGCSLIRPQFISGLLHWHSLSQTPQFPFRYSTSWLESLKLCSALQLNCLKCVGFQARTARWWLSQTP